MKLSASLALAAVASSATAHTIFTNVNNNGIGEGVRVPSYNGPITNVQYPKSPIDSKAADNGDRSNDVVCNGGPNPTQSTDKVIDLQAGSQVTLQWRYTLQTAAGGQVIDASHKGPVMAYMKKVSNAKTDSGVGGGWFKIYEDGFDGSKWGVDRLIANGGKQVVTIPQCIAPGQYLLRGELIALHNAGSTGGAQLYMECAQVNILGGSASKTPSTVSFPGAYSANDKGILYNLYSGQKTYTAPGPAVFKC
ncbi:endoglucanase II [Westerdykella ornata]|uniref:AA9 family lytic polysaccharide monooxygenase n=1 Tax=Westerdykella ornata TaxID=318751 RepID=A0A6A6J4C2_WESOR|nr:endoglucanase II [Westerdykella ornata]KAF2271431.1 endoglucanase II [Westerdykella ornata]